MSGNRPPDFRVRIPEELKEKIRASAEEYNRSMGADIVARLEASFAAEESPKSPRSGVNVQMDSEWFKATGLTADEFATYVRLAILGGLTDDKGSE